MVLVWLAFLCLNGYSLMVNFDNGNYIMASISLVGAAASAFLAFKAIEDRS